MTTLAIHSVSAFGNCASTLWSRKVTIGLVSYSPEGSLSFARFARKYSALVEQAAHSGAKVVVFPELLVQDLVDHSQGEDSFGPQVRELADLWPKFLEMAEEQAKKWNIVLYSGTFTRREGDKIYNTGALIFPDGKVATQDKVYLTPFEKKWKLTPGRALTVFETPWGPWVNLICYDCEIPRLSDTLATIKPTLILVPSMTEATSGFHRVRWTAQARAIEHKSFVVHVGMVGGPEEWPNHGQASAIAPFDDVLHGLISESQLNAPGVHMVDLDFDLLERSRQSDSVYPGRDQSAPPRPNRPDREPKINP